MSCEQWANTLKRSPANTLVQMLNPSFQIARERCTLVPTSSSLPSFGFQASVNPSPPIFTSPTLLLLLTSQNLTMPSGPQLASSASLNGCQATLSTTPPCDFSSVEFLTWFFSGFWYTRHSCQCLWRANPEAVLGRITHPYSQRPLSGSDERAERVPGECTESAAARRGLGVRRRLLLGEGGCELVFEKRPALLLDHHCSD